MLNRRHAVKATLVVASSISLLLLAMPAYAARSEASKEKNNKAVQLITQKKYQEAVSLLNEIIKAEPAWDLPKENLSIALNNLALQVAGEKKLDEAYSCFCKALFLNPTNKATIDNSNTMVHMMGKDPKSFEDRVALGEAALKKNDVETAIISFEAALKSKPDPALDKRVKSLLAAHPKPAPITPQQDINWGPVIGVIQSWVRSAWNPPHLEHSNRCIVLWKVLPDGAITNIRIKQKSDHPELDRACIEAANFAAPYHPLPQGWSKDIDIEMTFDYNVWSQQRKVELDHAKSFDPTVKPASFNPLASPSGQLYVKGKECFAKKDYDGAICNFTEALDKSISYRGLPVVIKGHLSDALLKKSKESWQSADTDEAIKMVRQALVLEPDRVELQEVLNKALQKSGKDLESFDTRMAMADELLSAGEPDQALYEYRAALKLKPDVAVSAKITKTMKMQTASEKAKKWRFYLEKVPNSLDGHLGLAMALVDMNKNLEAREELDKVLKLDPHHQTALGLRTTLEASAEKPE